MPKYERHAESASLDMISRGFKPLGEYLGSQKPWLVQCMKCEHQFSTSHFKVKRGDLKNCPNCRDLAEKLFAKAAEDLMKTAGLTPLTPYSGLNSTPWDCLCNKCGSSVSPTYAAVRAGSGGCIKCGIKASADSKRLTTEETTPIMLAANLRPLEPFVGARESWRCECLLCGSTVFPTYNGIQQGEGGCKECGRKAASAKTRVPFEVASEIMKSMGYEPIDEYVNSASAWKSRCLNCGKIVNPSLSNVKKQQNFGCVYCMGGRVDEQNAVKIMESAGVIPTVPYPGKDSPWEAKCVKCQRIVTPTYANARRGQGGCKFCAEHGIDLVAPAYLYVLHNRVFNAYKVGIGKSGVITRNDRLYNLGRNGWEVIRKFEYETGLQAQTHEFRFFQILRNEMKIPMFLSSADMKNTAGHTETMDADLISSTKIIDILLAIRQMPLP